MATKGEPDITALDKLIAGFEDQFSTDELDPNIWKAYFRANAEYCTRCSLCEDSLAQERMLHASKAPGPGHATRPQDISSDEDEDDAMFDPLVVTRSSPEGRMMSKWLLAARRKIGGQFPRPQARRQMERYAQKLRQLKMKKSKDAVNAQLSGQQASGLDPFEQMQITAVTKALALRWIRMARDKLESKFRIRGQDLAESLEQTLEHMPEEDDWYFGGAMRLEGHDLMKRGNALDEDRRTLETEAALKINKIKADKDTHVEERENELARERKVFEAKLVQQSDRIAVDIDIRRAELEQTKVIKKREFLLVEKKAQEESGAASTALIQSHR